MLKSWGWDFEIRFGGEKGEVKVYLFKNIESHLKLTIFSF